MKINVLLTSLAIGITLPALVWAEGKKPENSHPPKTSTEHRSVKDSANETLNDVDKGVHKAIPAVKKGANDAMDAVDRGVHKVIEPSKK